MTAVLDTGRLLLRQFVEDDAPLLFDLDSDPEVMRYIGLQFALADEAAYRERIRNYFLPYHAKCPDFGFWVAEEKASGRFVGWFHLRPALDYRFAREAGFRAGEFDIGFRLVRAAWGNGYATEVTRALVRRGFAHPAVEAVVACALVGNRASCRVLEKCGLLRVCQFALPGFEMPAVKYAVTRGEVGGG
jgi:[ribosomal protein S5]-alanine N-acetyltransferase